MIVHSMHRGFDVVCFVRGMGDGGTTGEQSGTRTETFSLVVASTCDKRGMGPVMEDIGLRRPPNNKLYVGLDFISRTCAHIYSDSFDG